MRITKFEHAALRIDDQDASLLIDPGMFTSPIDGLERVVAVVLTHEHADHWTPAHLDAVRAGTPDVPIYGPAGVAGAAADYDVTAVAPGDTVSAGPFTLRFFGGAHEVIHSSLPVVDNVGVLIDDAVYYPGDSYAVPDGVDVDVLAAPLGAPWLRIGDAMDFVTSVHAGRVFGTHDMTLSDPGRAMHRGHLQRMVEGYGGQFLALDPGDGLDV